nr:hypothetical protein [synthetic construct]AXG22007.1 hypothetical protein [synthetic construct]
MFLHIPTPVLVVGAVQELSETQQRVQITFTRANARTLTYFDFLRRWQGRNIRLHAPADGLVHGIASNHTPDKKVIEVRSHLVQTVLFSVINNNSPTRIQKHRVLVGVMRHGPQGLQNTRFPEKVILTVLEINVCNGVRRVHAADHKRALSGPSQRHTRALETHEIAFEAF